MFYIVNLRTNFAKRKSAFREKIFASAYKFFYMLCRTSRFLAVFA